MTRPTLSVMVFLGGWSAHGGAESGEPARLEVEPRFVITDETSPRSLVFVTVTDAGGLTVPGAEVRFESQDPAQIVFPYPSAWTDAAGQAVNVVVRVPERAGGVFAYFTVTSGSAMAGPISVVGKSWIVDGALGFAAPPLRPFQGTGQRLVGVFFPFISEPRGTRINAWSIDPTIAEPGHGLVVAPRDPVGITQPLEFRVIAHRLGKTVFIVGLTDLPLYDAEVAGELHPPLRRGDATGDGTIDIADPIAVLGFLFLGGDASCVKAADANDSGALDVSDAIYLLSYLFTGGPPPGGPHPSCGEDPTDDSLDCDSRGC